VDNITGGERGERATGTPNTIYDLSSVLFHALEGGASYDTYIQDAEQEGDQELAEFFRRVRDEDSIRADEAQHLLAERTHGGTAAVAGGGAGAASARELPRTEDTAGGVHGQHDMAAAPVSPMAGPGRGEPEVSPSTQEAGPLGREERGRQPERGDREEDKGLLDRAKDALVGDEEESTRREGTDRPEQR
jgi:hypothetical protein